jgi:hypothetical protein
LAFLFVLPERIIRRRVREGDGAGSRGTRDTPVEPPFLLFGWDGEEVEIKTEHRTL